jgi:GR25 family glycosyltransferase involved in LPS biosynthesis
MGPPLASAGQEPEITPTKQAGAPFMHCTYINLDHKTDRKAGIELNFADTKGEGWTLERFPAIDAEFVKANKIPGSLRETERACFLSHKYAIKAHLQSKNHLMVVEDDILFGHKTCQTIDEAVAKHQHADWDIFYAEVCVPDITNMAALVKMRQQWQQTGQSSILDLRKMVYAGATAYVINAKSKQKVFNLLDKSHTFNIPYDLYLRRLVHEGKLNAYALFPFVTSFSDEALNSDIREDHEKATDLVWIQFRKLIWQERDLAKEAPTLRAIKESLVDEETEAFATVISAMLSPKFVNK